MTEPGVRLDAFAVAPCGEHGAIRIELDSAGEPHSKMTQAENLVAQVSDLAELGMGPVGELSLVLEFLTDRGVTSLRAPVRNPFEGGVPHTVGVPEPDPCFDIAAVPGVQCTQKQLHVLLRHRPPVSR